MGLHWKVGMRNRTGVEARLWLTNFVWPLDIIERERRVNQRKRQDIVNASGLSLMWSETGVVASFAGAGSRAFLIMLLSSSARRCPSESSGWHKTHQCGPSRIS